MRGSVSDLDQDVLAMPAADAEGDRVVNMGATTTVRSQHEPVARSHDDARRSEGGGDELRVEPPDQRTCVDDARLDASNEQVERGGGLAFGLVILLLAVISYFVYSFVERFSESIGVHPVVTAIYGWGGTVVVPALLGGAGCLLLVSILVARRRA